MPQAAECLAQGNLLGDIQRRVKPAHGLEGLPRAKQKTPVCDLEKAAIGIQPDYGQARPNWHRFVQPGEAPATHSSLMDGLNHRLQQLGADFGVGIHEDEQIPLRGSRPRVAGRRNSPMIDMHRAVGKSLRDLSGPVSGAIVGNHGLKSPGERPRRLPNGG